MHTDEQYSNGRHMKIYSANVHSLFILDRLQTEQTHVLTLKLFKLILVKRKFEMTNHHHFKSAGTCYVSLFFFITLCLANVSNILYLDEGTFLIFILVNGLQISLNFYNNLLFSFDLVRSCLVITLYCVYLCLLSISFKNHSIDSHIQ